MLARCYMTAHRWLDAAPLLENLLPLYRQVHGPENSAPIGTMDALAQVYVSARRWDDAIPL